MSLMYEALRPKSSAECSPGFSAFRTQTVSARYVEKLNSRPNNSLLKRKIIAWMLGACVLALFIVLCVFIVAREQKSPEVSKNNSIDLSKNLVQPLPSVTNTTTHERTNQRNESAAISISPAPLFAATVIQTQTPSEIDKKSASTSSVLVKRVIEEGSSDAKNLPVTQKTSQKESVETPRLALVGKPEELIINPDSAQKMPDKEPVVATPVQAATQVNDALTLADHFDAMNRELSKGAKSQAGTHLKAIQAALAPSSLSRLRAEGWYEYHLGNLEASKTIYRRILNRVPGDENATSVLQVIEAKSGNSSTSK